VEDLVHEEVVPRRGADDAEVVDESLAILVTPIFTGSAKWARGAHFS
jgi:hypothetical protein